MLQTSTKLRKITWGIGIKKILETRKANGIIGLQLERVVWANQVPWN